MTAKEGLGVLDEAGVPADIVRNIEDLARDQHMRQREAMMEFEDPQKGTALIPGVFPKLAKTPGRVSFLGAKLGEQKRDVFGEFLGLSTEDIAELERDGVI